MATPPARIAEFDLVDAPADAQWSWPVYRAGDGPPVIVLHEVFGLTEDDVAFARRIKEAGFTVWVPVLVGPAPSVSMVDRVRAVTRVCVSREIYLLRRGRTSRIVKQIVALAQHLIETTGAPGVGVIGMCMSGGFALAMAASPEILAAVVAEPALPYASPVTPWCAKDPGVSATDLEAAHDRLVSGDVEVLLTRFSDDGLSPSSRTRAISQALGSDGFTIDEIPSGPANPLGFSAKAHSVLAIEPARPNLGPKARARLDDTFDGVVRLLNSRLR